MDAVAAVLAVGAGASIGIATGLVPGLHVNTLAALSLLVLAPGPEAALALVAVGTVHTFVSILPATYLGAPGEDTAVVSLPAHRMLHDGLAPLGVHLSAHASLLALLAAVLLLLPVKWLLGEPLRLLSWLDRVAPWILVGVLLLLVLQEARRGWARLLGAAATMALAAWAGVLARSWPVQALLPVPASPLLPLLTGLFGVPTLLHALQAAPPPHQSLLRHPYRRPVPRGSIAPALQGVGAAAFTAVLPGLTAAVATAVARGARGGDDPRPVIATLSAVNTAHAVLSLCMLWLALRPRSGLAIALSGSFDVQAWQAGAPPAPLVWVLAAAVAAGLVGHGATLLLDRPFARLVPRLPTTWLHGGALAVLVLLCLGLAGPWGLLLLAVASLVGLVPLSLRVRRVNLVAALIVPVL